MFLFDVNFVTSFSIFSRRYQKVLMNDLKLRQKILSLYKHNSIKPKTFSSQVCFDQRDVLIALSNTELAKKIKKGFFQKKKDIKSKHGLEIYSVLV